MAVTFVHNTYLGINAERSDLNLRKGTRFNKNKTYVNCFACKISVSEFSIYDYSGGVGSSKFHTVEKVRSIVMCDICSS